MRTKLYISVLILVATLTGCVSRSASLAGQVFQFSSGGAYHFEGFGEWRIRLEAGGALSIEHDVRGEVKDYGTFTLSDKENQEMWELIQAADIENLETSQRTGMPDEVQYTFNLKDGTQAYTAKIWIDDARQNERLGALVDRLGALIESYTGREPVLK
jgi:hypothetical protein